jgi:hypothetical protein
MTNFGLSAAQGGCGIIRRFRPDPAVERLSSGHPIHRQISENSDGPNR